MKIRILFFCFLLLFTGSFSYSKEWAGDGTPLKYVSSCELDLNTDGMPDLVFLVETIKGRELIAIVRSKLAEAQAHFLWKGPASNGLHLQCKANEKEIKATMAAAAGKSAGQIFKTNGAVIQLFKPESSSITFYWERSKFQTVVTAD